MLNKIRSMFGGVKESLQNADWQAVMERLSPERITGDPRFQRFVEKLNLPDYVKGPDNEQEFLPAALEVIETPPLPASRIIGRVIIAFFCVAVVWSCFGTVDIIATAPGKIIPTGHTKVIQPLESGVIRAIHVQDGQAVKADDILVEIDSTISEAERNRLQNEYAQASFDAIRLKAALNVDGNATPAMTPPEGASAEQIDSQKTLLTNQMAEIRAKLRSLDEQIAQQEGNRSAVQATIDKLKQSIPYLQERAQAREYLAQKGYGSKLDYLSTQQDLVEHQQELHVQQGRLTEAAANVAALQHQRQEAEAEYKRKTSDDLTQAANKAASLHEQLVQANEKFELQTLKAPVDGTVQQLAVHTEGGVVTPAQPLMVIVPADSHIEIEAMVSNRDIGFVEAGQDAEVKVDTFNFTQYGLLQGKILTVSHDAIQHDRPTEQSDARKQIGAENESSEPKGQELVYAARVALDQTQMEVDGRLVSLEPGMAVTVEIKTGKRRIISYLFSPLQKHMHQALRER